MNGILLKNLNAAADLPAFQQMKRSITMGGRNLTLLTDLYELTMMQGYFKEKDANETVIFDAFYRSNPNNAGYAVCAGLDQVIE